MGTRNTFGAVGGEGRHGEMTVKILDGSLCARCGEAGCVRGDCSKLVPPKDCHDLERAMREGFIYIDLNAAGGDAGK